MRGDCCFGRGFDHEFKPGSFSVIEDDLPAAENMGALGRSVMSVQANLNALLNPNLTMAERERPHRIFEVSKADLNTAMEGFDRFIKGNAANEALSQVSRDWTALTAVSKDWLSVSNEIFDKYKQWEDTKILNTTELLMSLEKYRGDHYFLVRRMAEMVTKDQTIGAEVSPDDTLCAFGQWRKRFEGGTDLLAQNQRFQEAMGAMAGPHKEFHSGAAELYRLIKENPLRNRDRIQTVYLKLLTDSDQVVGTFAIMIAEAERAQNIYQEASALSSGRLAPLRDGTLASLDDLLLHKHEYDQSANTAIIDSGRRGLIIMQIVGLISLVIAVVLAAIMVRSIRNTMDSIISGLAGTAQEVDSASGQLSVSSNSLAEGATENAASLEETSAALEELSSMTKRNADNSVEANALMSQATMAVQKAEQSMASVITAMDEISVSGNEIGKIIKTIDEIAFQTNLLALNAAVEAARAGEAGAGFAVVADEVRNLAIRSAEAAKNTSGLIASTITNIQTGSEMVNLTADNFRTVESHSSKVAELLAEVAEASKEQAQGIGQITTAMTQMDKVTQSNAASAEESASAAGQLSLQAGTLLGAVDDLTALVHGAAGGGSQPGVSPRPALPAPHPARPVRKAPAKSLPMDDDNIAF